MPPAWWLIVSTALAAGRAAAQLTAGSSAQVVLAAAIVLGALAAIVQVRPFLPPGGLQIATGLVLLEMGVHALFDGLRRPSRMPGPTSNPGAVLTVGESVMAGILLAWVTNRLVWVGLAVATGIVTGATIARRRQGSAEHRWLVLGVAVWFLGSSALLLFGTSARPGSL